MTGASGNVPETEAAGQVQPDGDLPAWQTYADDPVTLDWYINYSWFSTPWGENLVSQTITEETGVDIHFITPLGNESEKLNALIASDSLPDLITLGWWEPQVSEMTENGMVYALNELADSYDPYFWSLGPGGRELVYHGRRQYLRLPELLHHAAGCRAVRGFKQQSDLSGAQGYL